VQVVESKAEQHDRVDQKKSLLVSQRAVLDLLRTVFFKTNVLVCL
jgi:hypothetical protein